VPLVAKPQDAQALLRSIETITRESADDRVLRSGLLEALGRYVGFDAYAWVLTDPGTSVGTSPLAAVPDLAELPRLVRAKYLTAVNRWTALDTRVVSLEAATGDDLEQSLVWREALRSVDVVDVASAAFRDRFGCWAFLDLWRINPSPRFTPPELRLLEATLDPITTALRRSHAHTFAAASPITRGLDGPVVLLLSEQLDVLAETEPTIGVLRALLPTPDSHDPIPAAAYNVAAQLLARESGTDLNPPSARIHVGHGRWMTLRAAHLPHLPSATIAVTIENISAEDRADLFARVHALTPREAELVAHLGAGNDTSRIAELMFLSAHTVQDHLKAIFAKTSVRNRRSLLTLVRGA
jgi:DNA-binding CsgD family transcriptional regulator